MARRLCSYVFICLIVHLFCLSSPMRSVGQEKSWPEKAIPRPHGSVSPESHVREVRAPALEVLAPGVFAFGALKILKKEERIELPAVVNMDKGLLEYLIVGTPGKVHESLLRTEVEPYHLQLALLLLGLRGTNNPLAYQGDPRCPEGDPVSVSVRWQDGNVSRENRIEDWVVNKAEGSPLNPIHWIFTGSVVRNGAFMAQVEKSIVAVYHDPIAMFDNPLPDGGNDEIWFVREGRVPPVGREVTVIITKETKDSIQ
jgi:hypothetical protein